MAGGSRDSKTATDAIRKTLNCQGDLETHELADASGRIILCRGLCSQDICTQDGSTAVILGRPDWSEEELASLAREQGPATALIAGYQKLGREVLKQLHGPFALAVKVKQKALLAVDRIGIHTLSYGFRDGVFAFGSSARSVAAHPAFGLDPDPQALYHFFYKEALKDFLPQETLRKEKHGFGLPFGEWALSHSLFEQFTETPGKGLHLWRS